jgi:hypothetical protein
MTSRVNQLMLRYLTFGSRYSECTWTHVIGLSFGRWESSVSLLNPLPKGSGNVINLTHHGFIPSYPTLPVALPEPTRQQKMTNWTWLQGAADIATIASSLASWRGLVGLALAVTAWVAVDWRKIHDALHLGTQISRLRDEQYNLADDIFPDNYLRMSPAHRDRAINAIHGYVLTPIVTRRFLILSSLDADILDCHARYLALPTLGWPQYTAEVFNLHLAVRETLKRLHEVKREIEVCPRYFASFYFASP